MKKVIAVFLALIMVFTLTMTAGASKGNDNEKSHKSDAADKPDPSGETIDELLSLIKYTEINSEMNKKILKQIIEYRHKKGDWSMPVFFNNVQLTLAYPTVVRGYEVYLPTSTLTQVAGAVITEGDAQMIAAISDAAQGNVNKYLVIDKKTGKVTLNGNSQKFMAKWINKKLYIPADLFSGSLGFIVQYDRTNGALMIYTKGFAPAVLTAPTSITITPVGGTVTANTLNFTNTNLVVTAAIIPGQAAGGRAELLLGSAVVASDTTITSSDAIVIFDLGKTTNAQLQAAVPSGGVVSVRLYNSAGNFVTSTANPTLTVDYTAPVVTSAAFTGPAALRIAFSEAVHADAANFTDGRFYDLSTGNTLRTFSVTSLSGSGTNVLTLALAPAAVLETGDTGSIDISSAVRDLRGNPLIPLDNYPIGSGSFTPVELTAPTAVTVTPIGGTIAANTLNTTNTNLIVTAAITPGQAAGGKAELLIGSSVIAVDPSIIQTDAMVFFDLGKTTNAQLKAAVPAGGVVSVRLYNSANNFVTSTGNPTLVVDYTVPAVLSASFTGPAALSIVFSEAVYAAAADFTDGRFHDANDGNNVKTFYVASLTGNGTNVLTLTVVPSTALQTGDTGYIDISGAVRDLRGNALVPIDNHLVVSGF